jgi:hypothetical protein
VEDLRLYALGSATMLAGHAGIPGSKKTLAEAMRQRVYVLNKAYPVEAGLVVGASYELEGEPKMAREAYDAALAQATYGSGQTAYASAGSPSLRLIVAHGNLMLNRNFQDTLKPSLKDVCKDADHARDLAREDDSSLTATPRAQANAFAGDAWDQRALEAATAYRNGDKSQLQVGLDAARKAVDAFEEAVRLLPDAQLSIRWRYRAAVGLDVLARFDMDKRCDLVKKANRHLTDARAMTTDDDKSLREEIDKELDEQKKKFADCLKP